MSKIYANDDCAALADALDEIASDATLLKHVVKLQMAADALRARAVPKAMCMQTGAHDPLMQSFVNGWNSCRNAMLADSKEAK